MHAIQINPRTGRGRCISRSSDSYFASHILPPLRLAYRIFVPFIAILVTNICIIIKLARRKLGNAGTDYKITVTLISVSVLYLVTQAPMTVYAIVAPRLNLAESSREKQALFRLYWCLVSNFSVINNAGNFALYCFTGSRFRQELWEIFCFWRGKGKKREIPIPVQGHSSTEATGTSKDPAHKGNTKVHQPLKRNPVVHFDDVTTLS